MTETNSKYVKEKDGDLYIKDRRVNVYGHRIIFKLFGKGVKKLTDEDVEKYEEWSKKHGSVVTPTDLVKRGDELWSEVGESE